MSLSKPYKMDDTRYKRVLVYSRYVLVVINMLLTLCMILCILRHSTFVTIFEEKVILCRIYIIHIIVH